MSETYNGWTNRETWAVALHINNDQGWQEQVHERLREALRDPSGERLPCGECGYSMEEHDHTADHDYRASLVSAGEIIRENVEETLVLLAEGVKDNSWDLDRYGSVRNDIGSLWRVNWTELGASFLEDIED